MHSCLYVGQVKHRRFTPRSHQFSYRLFMLYLDLDELPRVFERFLLWSVNRKNLAAFRRKDHLGKPGTDLAEAVRDKVAAQTGQRPTGPIRLLTHLAYFGFRFNPVSFYYCFSQDSEELQYIVAEVNNTPWGEQHCYVMDKANNQGSPELQRYFANKEFHVSPFMPMDIDYDWRFSRPKERLSVHMENWRYGQKVFDATLMLKQRPINSTQLAKALTFFPFMTLKIVAAIYFEALRLWLKRTPLFDHPNLHAATTPASIKVADADFHTTQQEAPDSVKTS